MSKVKIKPNRDLFVCLTVTKRALMNVVVGDKVREESVSWFTGRS